MSIPFWGGLKSKTCLLYIIFVFFPFPLLPSQRIYFMYDFEFHTKVASLRCIPPWQNSGGSTVWQDPAGLLDYCKIQETPSAQSSSLPSLPCSMVFDAARPRRLALPLLTSLVLKGCRLPCGRAWTSPLYLGASFFFSRGGDVSHAGSLQVLPRSLRTTHYLSNGAFEKRLWSIVMSPSLRDQWRQLILDPLPKLDRRACQLFYILVVDALDECEGEKDAKAIMQLFAE